MALINAEQSHVQISVLKFFGIFKGVPADTKHGNEAARIVALVDKAINQYWTSNFEVTKDFRVEFVRDVTGDFRSQVFEVVKGNNPFLENRKTLASAVISLAKLQVLVLDKKNDPEDSLLLQPGISGELKPLLFDIWNADGKLRELIEPVTHLERKDWDAVWNPVLFKYRISWSRANIFNAMRAALNDGDISAPDDWFRTLFMAQCVYEENNVRDLLTLPSLLDNNRITSNLMALSIGTLFNRVVEGHERPDVAWRDKLNTDDLGRRCLAKMRP